MSLERLQSQNEALFPGLWSRSRWFPFATIPMSHPQMDERGISSVVVLRQRNRVALGIRGSVESDGAALPPAPSQSRCRARKRSMRSSVVKAAGVVDSWARGAVRAAPWLRARARRRTTSAATCREGQHRRAPISAIGSPFDRFPPWPSSPTAASWPDRGRSSRCRHRSVHQATVGR